MHQTDIAVIGAGLVGLATARALGQLLPGVRVMVIDKEPGVAMHQSGRNSGVVHSGLYYAPGTVKARLCTRGAALLAEYCSARGIELRQCGKVIVALDEADLASLKLLRDRGEANGVKELELVGPEELRRIEPACRGVGALWSPTTAIVDFESVAEALKDDIVAAGGEFRLLCRVQRIRSAAHEVEIATENGTIRSKKVVACAGLQADRVARLTGSPRYPLIAPFRGDFFKLAPARRELVRGLIYPAPHPTFPFLGIHFTPRISGNEVWIGPTAAPSLAREGYRRRSFDLSDTRELLGSRAFWRFGVRNLVPGLVEIARDYEKHLFLRAARQYIPDLISSDLLPGPVGIRAQALDVSGLLVDDFVIDTAHEVVTHVRNAPSPAATSSLAIGEHIARLVLGAG